jgi:hypothetical protein
MWVKLDAVTKDSAHGAIEGHEGAPDKLVAVEDDAHSGPNGNGRNQEGVGEVRSHNSGNPRRRSREQHRVVDHVEEE